VSCSSLVPQGSFLGILLFSVYDSPVGDLINRKGVDYNQHTDDTQLFLFFCLIDWLIDFRPCQHDNGYIDVRSQIKVRTDERTQVHSTQSFLAVTHPSTNRNQRYLTSVTDSPSKHWSPLRTAFSLETSSTTADLQKLVSCSLAVKAWFAENEQPLNADQSDAMQIGTLARLHAVNNISCITLAGWCWNHHESSWTAGLLSPITCQPSARRATTIYGHWDIYVIWWLKRCKYSGWQYRGRTFRSL